MKSTMLPLVILALWVSLNGCQKFHPPGQHTPILEEIQKAPVRPIDPKHVPKALPMSSRMLLSVQWDKPHRNFLVPKRTAHIKRFPCQKCHFLPNAGAKAGFAPTSRSASQPTQAMTNPLTASVQTPQFRVTHGDIQFQHAPKGTLQCASCHHPQEMNFLRTPAGKKLSFDRSYELCGSCHRKQANDWAGGAHGKRIAQWLAPKRLIYTCTQCHNPHNPLAQYDKRWPKAFFRFPEKRGTPYLRLLQRKAREAMKNKNRP